MYSNLDFVDFVQWGGLNTLLNTLLCHSVLPPNPLLSELKDAGFDIKERGHIEVKGKGLMTTYFLLGNLLMSEDCIMGKAAGQTCLYREDLHDQTKKGKNKCDG